MDGALPCTATPGLRRVLLSLEKDDTAKSLQCPSQAVAPALPDHDRADTQGCSGGEAAILTELSVHEIRLKARQGKDLLQSKSGGHTARQALHDGALHICIAFRQRLH